MPTRAELDPAGDRLARAVEALAPALLVLDADEKFVYANRAAEILVGRPRADLLGRTIEDALGAGGLGESLAVVARRARSGGKAVEYRVAYDLPSGAHFDVGLTATTVETAAAGGPVRSAPRGAGGTGVSDVVVVGRERHAPAEDLRVREGALLSARQQAELRGLVRQAERQMARSEKLVAVGQMAAGFVHEINNPLGALSGLVQVLQEEMDQDDPASKVLVQMSSELARIHRVAEDMLELARSHAGAGSESFGPVEMNALVCRVLDLMQPQFKVARVKSEHEARLRPAWVLGDADRLYQVLMNLMLNAVQAMQPSEVHPPPGGRLVVRVLGDAAAKEDLPPRPKRVDDLAGAAAKDIRLEAVLRATGSVAPPWTEGMPLVRVEVQDTGPGVPREIADRLFEPFFTTKPRDQGTGLGLSTAEATVRAHGGSIRVENPQTGGARFVIRLPACAAPEPPAADVHDGG